MSEYLQAKMEKLEDSHIGFRSRLSTVEGKIDAVLAMNILVVILTMLN